MSSEKLEKDLEYNNSNNSDNNDCDCDNQVGQLKSSFARISADFENYKKRISKDQINWRHNNQSEIFLELLLTIDSFDQAFYKYESGKNPELDAWLEGFKMIHKNFYSFLDKFNIKIIDSNIPFDPEYHEALSQVESDKHDSGEIVEVLQKGFILGDRVLRPAKVSVAK